MTVTQLHNVCLIAMKCAKNVSVTKDSRETVRLSALLYQVCKSKSITKKALKNNILFQQYLHNQNSIKIIYVSGSGCDLTRDCDQNAKCESTWIGNEQKYVCQCLSGYSGDGHSCTEVQPVVSIFIYNTIRNFKMNS